jgi:hypothetical protein
MLTLALDCMFSAAYVCTLNLYLLSAAAIADGYLPESCNALLVPLCAQHASLVL